jgi:CheY-like chemotaxis protein/AraC-like DNA-binding protein
MLNFDTFLDLLKNYLHHYHAPSPQLLRATAEGIGLPGEAGSEAVRQRVNEALERLNRPDYSATGSHTERLYRLIHYRFLDGLTLEDTAQRLFVSPRQCQRIQNEAIHTLAMSLWKANRPKPAFTPEANWSAQVEEEIASVEGATRESSTDIRAVVADLLALREQLAKAYGVELAAGCLQPGLSVMVHPNILRQTLILAIGRLARFIQDGQITIVAQKENGNVKISLHGPVAQSSEAELVTGFEDVFIPQGGALNVLRREGQVYVQIVLPSTRQHLVLVIEDNRDIVHYYRRCTAGTNFQIQHAVTMDQVNECLHNDSPEIIVLDLMMAEIDGWQLLNYLHENPTTRTIPVIVCSIIYERDLALALGAVECLRKPVKHRDFLQALERALALAPSTD